MIDNGIGDLIRIADALPPEQWDDAARMLGFERATRAEPTPAEPTIAEATATPTEEQETPTRQREPASVPESALAPLTPTRVDTDLVTSVSWLQNTQAMRPPPSTRPAAATAREPGTESDFEPLIPRRTAAAVIAAMLATPRDGALDTQRAVREIARRKPLRRLPRRQRPTLARGAVVLTDTGDGLAPFAPDVQYIHDMISTILGQARVKVGWFTDDPRSGVWLDDEPIPVEALDPQVPIVILTDLGLIDTRTRTRCATLADIEPIAAHLGDQVHAVALVPVPLGPSEREPARRSRPVGTAEPRRRQSGASTGEGTEMSTPARDLARWCSLAVKIEPILLRALRLELEPWPRCRRRE